MFVVGEVLLSKSVFSNNNAITGLSGDIISIGSGSANITECVFVSFIKYQKLIVLTKNKTNNAVYQSLIGTNILTSLFVDKSTFISNFILGALALITIFGEAHFEKCTFFNNGAVNVLSFYSVLFCCFNHFIGCHSNWIYGCFFRRGY